jgi:hypothetical protein
MIKKYRNKSPRVLFAGIVSLLLGAIVCSKSANAADNASPDAKTAVAAGMQVWLKEIDDGQYGQSWKDASTYFKGHISSDKWVGALNSVRTPLGKCNQRQQVSVDDEKDPQAPGGVVKGEFMIVQFESSFENMKHAVETVTFIKEADGSWRSAGYLIHP